MYVFITNQVKVVIRKPITIVNLRQREYTRSFCYLIGCHGYLILGERMTPKS